MGGSVRILVTALSKETLTHIIHTQIQNPTGKAMNRLSCGILFFTKKMKKESISVKVKSTKN